eukprot:3301377-Rhodomonas_salina.1
MEEVGLAFGPDGSIQLQPMDEIKQPSNTRKVEFEAYCTDYDVLLEHLASVDGINEMEDVDREHVTAPQDKLADDSFQLDVSRIRRAIQMKENKSMDDTQNGLSKPQQVPLNSRGRLRKERHPRLREEAQSSSISEHVRDQRCVADDQDLARGRGSSETSLRRRLHFDDFGP